MSTPDQTLTNELAVALRNLIAAPAASVPRSRKTRGAEKQAADVLARYDQMTRDYSDYLANLPLVRALWWFIENVGDGTPHRTEYFFALRGRFAESKLLNDAEVATVVAALRYYQQQGQGKTNNRSPDINLIASGGGELLPLDDERIDELCEELCVANSIAVS